MKSFGNSSHSSSASNNLLSSFRSSLNMTNESGNNGTVNSFVPHAGALCRYDDAEGTEAGAVYALEIVLEDGQAHELRFSSQDFDFVQKLFAILDTESRGVVDRSTIKEFVTLRCPVFWRRDEDLRRVAAETTAACPSTNNRTSVGATFSNGHQQVSTSPTFDEVWKSVVGSCKDHDDIAAENDMMNAQLGVESWMVLCRFIALAQYLEAKRKFSARHLQQTMRHRNSPRGSEVVVVDVPPPEPPVPLSRQELASYEKKGKNPLPMPELDLDHSLVAAHDSMRRRHSSTQTQGSVKITLFGNSYTPRHGKPNPSAASAKTEFKLAYSKNQEGDCNEDRTIVVRRSMEDMKWLNDTFVSHNVLGGTLCGRILPPFPGSNGKILASQFQDDTLLNHSIKNTTGGAIAAASAGVGMIKGVAKSLWKGASQMSPSQQNHQPQQQQQQKPKSKQKSNSSSHFSLALPESYYNPNSPAGRARQLERYLNYLLEHPALSTSFPLNTILKASQSGLEAAKQSLEECHRLSKEVKDQIPQLVDGKINIPFWGSSGAQPSLSWVRTAAQAAMALKLHGILETTGMQSASARLQHASLPKFDHIASGTAEWAEEGDDDQGHAGFADEDEESNEITRTNSFEHGVISVQSELGTEVRQPNHNDGYDMLPLPVPAPERRILSAGASRSANVTMAQGDASSVSIGAGGSLDSRETRFHYGATSLRSRFPFDDEDDGHSAFLGDISVDEHIDKLREVIGSVDNTLSRCLASSGGIGRARRERNALHLDIVQGFDSWKGLRGKFIGQRALLKGISGIEQSNEVYEESDLELIDDVSWQRGLASSAVAAAEHVRSAVRAAKTAENAKSAASSAALSAQSACEAGCFATIDEARAAQTRASIAQSHAFHAAVVEHEAKSVKRRATLALAHDVKGWNIHRKREVLKACIAHARSQHEATRRAVDAWSCLRDGYIGPSVIPSAQTRKAQQPSSLGGLGKAMKKTWTENESALASSLSTKRSMSDMHSSEPANLDILSAENFADLLDMDMSARSSSAACSGRDPASRSADEFKNYVDPFEPTTRIGQNSEQEEATATIYQDLFSNGDNGKPVIVAVEHNILSNSPNQAKSPIAGRVAQDENISKADKYEAMNDKADKYEAMNEVPPFATESDLPLVTASPIDEVTIMPEESTAGEDGADTGGSSTADCQKKVVPESERSEILSASMQSLVDGLMTWGGQFDADDVLALPTGMAASIAFEESDVLSPRNTFA